MFVHRKRLLWWSGMGLCVLGVITGAQIPYFYWHSNVKGQQLIQQANQMVATNSTSFQKPLVANSLFSLASVLVGDTQTLPQTANEPLIGLVKIPSLHLTAPILEGTSATVLNIGAGHVVNSAGFGRPGTCVVAAHNATWFRHLDALKLGDEIVLSERGATYSYRVTGASIVAAGSQIANTAKPTVALVACYPLDALYLTAKRFVVTGVLVHTTPNSALLTPPSPSLLRYLAHVPVQLLHEGVTLEANALPLGSLRYAGTPSLQYTQSNAPLSAVYAMLQLYLSYVRASEDKGISDIYQLLQGANQHQKDSAWLNAQIVSNPFFGISASDISYLQTFNITLHVTGDALSQLEAVTTVRVPTGVFTLHFTARVKGQLIFLQSIQMQR